MRTRSPAEDIRSRKVIAADGDEIGKIDAIIIDDRDQKVRFIQVASGGFLGLGKSKSLLPVEAIARIDDEVVHVDQTRARIASAPVYDPELVEERYYEGLYNYYGYPPFWTAGYTYPPYPHYPLR